MPAPAVAGRSAAPVRELARAAARHAPPHPVAERVRRALEDHAQVARLSRTFRALGDPTRSKLVYALSLAELCVGDLAQALNASPSAISHQLRILRDLDIVRVRRDGRSQLYALNERAFGFCAPRVCMAWRQTLEVDGAARALGGARRGPRARRAQLSGRAARSRTRR
jgi:DNA-binding transcriptional ArsR family regulator